MRITTASTRACDRCYQLKERCQRVPNTSSCERCQRLSQVCSTVRPVRPTCRRTNRREKRASNLSSLSSSGMDSMHHVGLWLQETPDLSSEEKELLAYLLSDSQILHYSVISPRFKDAEQQSFLGLLPAAWPILKDAYLAYAGVLKSLHPENTAKESNDSHLRRVTSAMMALRNLPITTAQDAELCLNMGFALAATIHTSIGTGLSTICHHCLTTTRPFIESAALPPKTSPKLTFLVLMETMDCLVTRSIPTLRLPPPTPGLIDPHLGLALPLLSAYHDLCTLSATLASAPSAAHIPALTSQLATLHAVAQSWTPDPPKDFLAVCTPAEAILLLAQARAYRIALLLLIHRLQHPFGGARDVQADVWAREVLGELEVAHKVAGAPVRCVELPFLIAAVEVRGRRERERVKGWVGVYVNGGMGAVREAGERFLEGVWEERDRRGEGGMWLEWVHTPCVVLETLTGG
ncbi:hypothetical protein BS50DRAFT_650689 [Corynespora cassiicola Philippines]|uniref:Zn(2)-C6 fungal-type domain-containing protein n=1 Tax=Corynespora cassiicola Philippines TaxID=1448308 RepID=A0A2T2N9W9_CORCC|nr:hypothetical protein BS50DRAFT_650689 [Corynespora cassiicola Philippines]